jgi:hypothetical protein
MKMTLKLLTLIATTLFVTCSGTAQNQCTEDCVVKSSHIPARGFVPDEATAIAVAEAILVAKYGQESIDSQKPFLVGLENDVWTIWGHRQRLLPGGVFRIQISKQDASVKAISHGK